MALLRVQTLLPATCLVAFLMPSDSRAQVPAGVQSQPPPPATPPQQPVHDLGQRKAIRGCTVSASCQGPIQEALLEFELTRFPKPASNGPWAPAANSTYQGGRPTQKRPQRLRETGVSPSPLSLRPDLPWLANLKMPDIPVHWDHKIISFLEFYHDNKRGKNIMTAWLKAQGRYRDMMLKRLRKHKLPDSLLYISMIESSYSPYEYSRVGASGLWQFMPAAGNIYGLKQSRWLDERNDPIKSTDAVMFYFKDLYARFGDWDLAMAAFNAGYGAVIKSIAKYNTNDYWQLIQYENGLPWGTSHYVAKFLAAAIVGENLEEFGFADLEPQAPRIGEPVQVPSSVPLSVVARAAKTDLDTIKRLNPQFRRNRTPPGKATYAMRVPIGAKNGFAKSFAQLQGDWDEVDPYIVKHGERFEDIATAFGLSRSALRKLNGLASESEVRGGMLLVVPKLSTEKVAANKAKAEELLYQSGVPATPKGEKVLVALSNKSASVPGKTRHFYRVVSGDSQGAIAQAVGVNRFDLAKWNGLDPEAHLHPRMILQVWLSKGAKTASDAVQFLNAQRLQVVQTGSPEHLDKAEERVGRKRLPYSPKRPESLESIGKRFGLGKYDLARINHKSPDTVVAPGETILVYKVVDPKASSRAAEQAKSANRFRRKSR